jgi:hypothetical protein
MNKENLSITKEVAARDGKCYNGNCRKRMDIIRCALSAIFGPQGADNQICPKLKRERKELMETDK